MSDNPTFRKRGDDYKVQEGMRTLPGKYYHSEEIYQEEIDKIFYNHWILAGREEQIPNAGDFFNLSIEKESVLIVRDKSNEVQAHFNVCRHRGTQLCVEEKGNFKSKNIQCPYHAWTYGLDGKLIAAKQPFCL